MKKLFYVLVIWLSMNATAQENIIPDILKDYNFPIDLLAQSIGGIDPDAHHSFHATLTSCVNSETIIEEAKYDPSQKVKERWTLLTYNGKEPTKKELKEFSKTHNFKQEDVKAIIEDVSWQVELDNDDYLVVCFKYDSASSKGRYKYLADIKGKATFNKAIKRLERVEYTNERPTKIKPFNVTTFHMIVSFNYNETNNAYQVAKEEINMDVRALGKSATVKDVYEYHNYQSL